jgi:hypothetical protein
MGARAPSVEELWEWAQEDAGPGAAAAVLVPVATFGNPESRGRFMPPGERHVDLPADDLLRVNEHAARSRVVLPVDDLAGDPAVLLALMRHHLEYARVLSSARGLYAFTLALAGALSTPYGTAGRGSAVIYNAIPMMASANAAGGRLVARRLGPHFHRLEDAHFGSLFRVDDAPLELDELARRTVVCAAVWPDAVEDELGTSLDDLLARVDEAAPGWWRTVLDDQTFRAMAYGAATFRPTPEERAVFADFPAKAWWLVYGLIDRATRYGSALLATGDARTRPLESAR